VNIKNLTSPSILFFLLPFFLMAGVVLQSVGLYLCLLIIPWFASQSMSRGVRRVILSTSALLAACFFLPVVLQSILALQSDPLRLCVVDPPRVKSCDLTFRSWLKSPVSSSFIGLALGWGLIAIRKVHVRHKGQVPEALGVDSGVAAVLVSDDEQRFSLFAKGLFYASVLFFVYGLVQHFSGLSLTSATRMIGPEDRLPDGRYRLFSFFGHPLSLAGASLVWFSLSLFCLATALKNQVRVFGANSLQWGVLALIHGLNVLMSGGRTALLVVLLFAAFVGADWIFTKMRSRFFNSETQRPAGAAVFSYALILLLGLAAIAVLISLFGHHLNPRGMSSGTLGQGPLGDRPLFWQTYLAMWRDSPLLGQGYFAIEHGVRTDYYIREGFIALRDKYNAHNIYLEVLGITGILGLFSYLAILVLLFLNLKVLAGSSRERRWFLQALVWALIANLLHGLTQNTFFDSAVTACYLGLFGLLVVPPLKQHLAPNKVRSGA